MEYKKYRWFFTNSGKLVYGGKSAEQNEEIVGKLIKQDEDFLIMHTKTPGSPFAIIDSEIRLIKDSDIEEVAQWTGSFSRAWRDGKKEVVVDIFNKNQIQKKKGMNVGTFGVSGEIKRKKVRLVLKLMKQRGVLRAVPERTPRLNSSIYGILIPGEKSKEEISEIIANKLKLEKEEVLNALPTGGFEWKEKL